MLESKDLITQFEVNGISLYASDYILDKDCDITLKSDDLNILIQLMKENSIKSAFYNYEFLNRIDYLITDYDLNHSDEYSIFSDEIIENWPNDIKESVEQFNSDFNQKIFEQPIALSIFCILNGQIVGIIKTCTISDIPSKESFLTNLFKHYENILQQSEAQSKEQRAMVMQNALNYINSTNEWHNCTNKQLRRLYCAELVEKYAQEQGEELDFYSLLNSFEIIWLKHKNSLKKNTSKK